MKQPIRVTVETVPAVYLNGVLLNCPASNGGAFLIDARIERATWEKMRASGAWRLSEADIEDFDMFDAEPGWRYSLAALKVLLAAGERLSLRGEIVSEPARLDAMFSAEGQAEYKAREAAGEYERERADAEQKAAKEAEKEVAGRAYAAWKAERLAGLVKTFARDSGAAPLEWAKVAYFEGDTPGAWYTTGDEWFAAKVDGQTVYLRSYGNANACYAPQPIVDRWCEEAWLRMVKIYRSEALAARKLLLDSLHEYIGSDVAKRLLEIHGAAHKVCLATATEWWVFGESLGWEAEAAAHYGAPYVSLEAVKVSVSFWNEREKFPIGDDVARSLWRHPDGRLIAKNYYGQAVVVVAEDLPEAIRRKLDEGEKS